MRKATRTLFVILVVSCLALSSLMASPNTWGWLFSSQSSEASEEQTENLMEPAETSQKDSPSSEVTFEVVEVAEAEDDEWIMIRKSDYNKVVALFESAASKTAKAKGYVAEAKEMMEESAVPYIAPVVVKTPKVQSFLTLDAQKSLAVDGIDFGFSTGLIFKNCLMASMGVMKTGFNDWMNKDTYSVKASLGIVF